MTSARLPDQLVEYGRNIAGMTQVGSNVEIK